MANVDSVLDSQREDDSCGIILSFYHFGTHYKTSPLKLKDVRDNIDRGEGRDVFLKSNGLAHVCIRHQEFQMILFVMSNQVCPSSEVCGEDDRNRPKELVSTRTVPCVAGIHNEGGMIVGGGELRVGDGDDEMGGRTVVENLIWRGAEVRDKEPVADMEGSEVRMVDRQRGVQEMRSGRGLVAAAEEVKELRKALGVQGVDQREGEPLVYGLLRKEWMDCFDEVQDVLVGLIGNAVRVGAEDGRVRVRFRWRGEGGAEIELRTVLKAMEVAGVLDYGLAKVADSLVKYVIIPLVSNGGSFDFVEAVDPESSEFAEGGLADVPQSDAEVKVVDFYPGIIHVVKFVYKFICFQNSRWMQCFGRLAWPSTAELIISKFLSKAVPHDASKLAEFQIIINDTAEFETALKEIMFVSTDEKDKILSNYAQNVEVHFASRKKIEILAKARNMLSKCDFVIPPEYTRKGLPFKTQGAMGNFSEQTVDLLFLPERCVVSKAALRLMELVHDTLKDVCLSSTRVAMKFYHAARDALLLYEAVVPIKLEKQLSSVNQVAILVHNDCLFLSKEILGLAFEYRSAFPSSMKEQAVFVDMAPRFHQMAKEILQKQIQLVFRNLKEAIDGANGFQNTHQMQQYESAKFSIDQIVFILEKVHIIWEPLLLPSTYRNSMCAVLDFVFSKMTEDILLLDDMAAEETLQLQRLIQMVLDSLSSLFEPLLSINKKEEAQIDAHVHLDVLIPSLPKFRNLAVSLDISWKEGTTMTEKGEGIFNNFKLPNREKKQERIYLNSKLKKACLFNLT
ncbi:hypothetical protein Sjap_002983 [Stephania japonica]|uniref:Centromere/kinetochore protein zw10-like protein n=1 Tax=Stephania japonica TaxID=461633 RepID=A0AAP0KMW8_9MAGN